MSGKIDQAGHLELLLFRLNGKQRYGINVFKVQEVMPCPTLTDLPDSHPSVQGVANMRGHTIPVFDLSSAIGLGQHLTSNECHVIVTEFSRAMHGMLVREVEKIVTLAWDQILPPPKGMGKAHYLTAVAEVEDELVEIIDVERVIDSIIHVDTQVSEALRDAAQAQATGKVMVVDDSSVARHQIEHALEQIGVSCDIYEDGNQALRALERQRDAGTTLYDEYLMVISDIEMPQLNGYDLCQRIRADEALKPLFVLLHSSISGRFNDQAVAQSGADKFIPKYNPDDLAAAVLKRLHEQHPQP